jgi:hypothetical protein
MTGRVVDVAGVSQVIRYLRGHGFPHAERRRLARARELGAITGTPAVEWAVKGDPTAGDAGGRQVAAWVAASDAHRARLGAELGVLVIARASCDTAEWWAVVTGGTTRCARMPLSAAVELLIALGYGGVPGPEEGDPCPPAA